MQEVDIEGGQDQPPHDDDLQLARREKPSEGNEVTEQRLGCAFGLKRHVGGLGDEDSETKEHALHREQGSERHDERRHGGANDHYSVYEAD